VLLPSPFDPPEVNCQLSELRAEKWRSEKALVLHSACILCRQGAADKTAFSARHGFDEMIEEKISSQ
jgi:hypothetical protein